MKQLILTLNILCVSFISISQIEIGAYTDFFSGKFKEKNSFATSANHYTFGGGVKFGFDLPKKFQFIIDIGYNRYVNKYDNSTFEKENTFKNENYETKTTLNTTLNGFYYVDFLKFNSAIQYPIFKIKDDFSVFAKVGLSASIIINGYQEFHFQSTEKGKLYYQDSIYDINRIGKSLFVDKTNTFDYENFINIELLAGLGLQYKVTNNQSVFLLADYYYGVLNNNSLNDKYQSYSNSNEVILSRAFGLKIGYSFNINRNNTNDK